MSDSVIKIECDNTTAVATSTSRAGLAPASVPRQPGHTCRCQHNVSAVAVHRPGVNNVLADFLSRNRPDPNEWTLSKFTVRKLFRRWNTPQLDLFASAQNHQLPLWYSRFPHLLAAGTDALLQSWTGWHVYAFPPKNLILRTLLKIRSDQVEEAIVVVPHWPRGAGFSSSPDGNSPTGPPREDQPLTRTFRTRAGCSHPNLVEMPLTAWKLNGQLGNRQASASGSFLQHWQPNEILPEQSINLDGTGMPLGASTIQSSLYELL